MHQESDIRILFFADSHLGLDYPIRPRIERRRRGQDFFDNFQTVLDHAARRRMDLVIHGGDLFFRSRVPARIVDLVYQQLLDFAKHGIPIYIVPGNHERSRLPPSLLLNHPGISVFDRPKTFLLRKEEKTLSLSGFPFVRKNIRQDFKSIVSETGWDAVPADARLLCMHQAVEGAEVGPVNYRFRYGSEVIRFSDLPADCLAVLSGHIHRKQVLTAETENGKTTLIYPGSIERTSFAEKDERKGFFEIVVGPRPDSDAWHMKRLEFIELPSRPMVDVLLDPKIKPWDLGTHIRSQLAGLDDDSIVRFKCIKTVGHPFDGILTSAFLREVMPASMNFQLSIDFRTAKRTER